MNKKLYENDYRHVNMKLEKEDFCKKHVAYIKKSIFYIWQFTDENAIFGYIKLLVLILISVCYFAFYDYSVVPMITLALIGICILLIVIKRTLKLRKL